MTLKMLFALFIVFVIFVRGQSTSTVLRCKSSEILCDDRSCINKLKWCDTELNCKDGSDEIYCSADIPCHPDIHFECDNKRCIPITAFCDTYDDCGDSSDEENCNNTQWFMEDISISMESHSRNISSTTIQPLTNFNVAVDKAVMYLLTARDAHQGWGTFTPRAAIALSLASKVSKIAEEKKEVVLKELKIQILQDLMRKDITLSNLALYINALYAMCQDPRNFQGMDLVARLRSETDVAIRSNVNMTLPFLTLCLSNATRYNDNLKLIEMYNSKTFERRIGSKALIVLAMICIMHKDKVNGIQPYISGFFSREINNARIADVYTQAMFKQASIAGGYSDQIELASRQLSDGSFGDALSTYYAIPVLLNSSLLDIVCNTQSKISGLISKSDIHGAKEMKEITYSLWITSGKDPISHSTQVQVYGKVPIMDIMQAAASRDPVYRFLYENSNGKRVYSIAEIPNDIESQTSWALYVGYANNTRIGSMEGLKLLDMGIEEIFPEDKNHLVFWLKRDLSN